MYLFLGNLTTHTTILQDEDNSNPLVENGFCNDETNNEACNYDGGGSELDQIFKGPIVKRLKFRSARFHIFKLSLKVKNETIT